MKKGISVILAVLLAVSCLTGLSGCGSSKKTTLYVYNWGQYISEGDDGSLDVIAAFEEAYPNIRVQYSTYDSNEIMYSKLSNGGITVDVIIPSDYMIGRMVQEGMLEELNFDNIPNYQYIDDSFKNTSYDPENKYSVPYTWGTVGIIYNTKYVDEADVGGWDLLWNEKYAGRILMVGNERDAFAIAEARLGYSLNTEDPDELQAAADLLMEQKPLVQQYSMDNIYDAMDNEEAWIGVYYAGDCMLMMQENPDLAFYLPEQETFNVFIDAMCIPSCCQNKELAEIFINYMLSAEPAIANAEYIYYASPNSLVYEDEGYQEDLGEEAMEILYPEIEDFSALYNEYAYRNLDSDMLDFVNTLWETLKIS